MLVEYCFVKSVGGLFVLLKVCLSKIEGNVKLKVIVYWFYLRKYDIEVLGVIVVKSIGFKKVL